MRYINLHLHYITFTLPLTNLTEFRADLLDCFVKMIVSSSTFCLIFILVHRNMVETNRKQQEKKDTATRKETHEEKYLAELSLN